MDAGNPIDVVFGGLEKLGPGDAAHTLAVLHRLAARRFDVVVDAGCGTGHSALVLARELRTPVDAVDTHAPFLDELTRRAHEAGLDDLVRVHCMDMKDIPGTFGPVDLLWSEGAAYNVGFPQALSAWAPGLRSGGFAVVSELSWLRASVPADVRAYFDAGYPDLRPVEDNVAAAEQAGYEVLHTHALPREAWVDGYYDVLGPRARELAGHADPAVRTLATELLQEIDVFSRSEDSYGYVFYALRRP